MKLDPRPFTIDSRLAGVRRILAVTGGKGGIGKSSVASTLALLLARGGRRTGLLDLDFTGPSDHVLLGLDDRFPTEEFGIEPPDLHGIRFMSVAYFVRDNPVPLRGEEVTDALIELLAITRWGELDALVIDMPPGLGDATLDAMRLIRRAAYVVVATRSRVVLETVTRTLRLLTELRNPIAGVVENMSRGDSEAVRELAGRFDARFLGALPYDETLENATGDGSLLAATGFARALEPIAGALVDGGET